MKPRKETGASADKMQMHFYEQLETTAVTLLGKMAEKQVRKRGPSIISRPKTEGSHSRELS